MASTEGLGPSKDTAVGEIVTILLNGSEHHGVILSADRDGCCGVIKSFERLPNGKFGVIQRHGGVHVGDVLWSINEVFLEHMPHNEVILLLNDRNVLRKQLKFISMTEYINKKKKHAITTGSRNEMKFNFVSKIKRARVNDTNINGKFAEYEITCQWRAQNDKVYQWSVWRRFTEFEQFHDKIKKSLGWLVGNIEFPRSHRMTINKYSTEFLEKRKEELNTYWQLIIAIDKITEFDKHHCSLELKQFLDVENVMLNYDKDNNNNINNNSNGTSLVVSNKNDNNDDDNNNISTSPNNNNNNNNNRPVQRRLSSKQASSRRLSTKTDVNLNFTEETTSSVTTASKIKPVAQNNTNNTTNNNTNNTNNNTKTTSNTNTNTTSTTPPPVVTNKTPPMSVILTENFAKYTKMKSMLPEGAVRQRMGADGCTEAEIDQFFGVGNSTPEPLPVTNNNNNNNNNNNTNNKKSVPPPPPQTTATTTNNNISNKILPPDAPPKTAGRANLLADIAKRRIE